MTPQRENRLQIPGKTTLSIDLSHLGLLKIAGLDAKKLLQGQLTCNVEEVSPQQSRLGAYCLPQGRMISLFRLFQYKNDYYLQMPAEILPDTLATLKKYAPFFKVTLHDASREMTRLSYSGAQAEPELKKIFSALPKTLDDASMEDDVLILKLPGEVPHYELIAHADASHLIEKNLIAPSGDANAWKYLNINAGIPSLYSATIAKLLPHEVNLPALNGVSFNKGCYTGQEIVARMHYRGQLKKQMYRGRAATAIRPEPGADIYHEKACGIIVDSCQENDSSYQILFIAEKNDIESKQLFLDFAKITPIELMSLPV